MKRGLILLVSAIAAGVTAFCLTRSHKMEAREGRLMDSMPELAWVRNDLKLSDEQFAKVTELHATYRPKCMEMCRQIAKAHEKVEAAAHGSEVMTPELEAAVHELAETHAHCQQAMLRHIYETAAVLDKNQADRYLKTMLPFALDSAPVESASLPSR